MRKFKRIQKFTKELSELLVEKDISLTESLKIMKQRATTRNKKTILAADYILECLEKGEVLSNALITCPHIHFDDVYITFISFAEKSGNLKSTIEYLNCKCTRYKKNKSKLIGALIYPVFVILLTLGICVFLRFYLCLENTNELYEYFLLFFGICGILVFVIWKVLSLNKMYEAFLGTDLLVKNGVNIATAVSYGALIAGTDSKVGKMFILASEKMEYGMNIKNAFSEKLGCFNFLSCKDDFLEMFFYADISGGKKDVFEKVATWIAEKDEKRRLICLQLIEPAFIAVTGVFLLMIVLNFFMPMLNSFSFV